ncbi:MAG: aminotransferase class I/II-fold pyridoxal phosphate-dependent enzyme, partial [bacterium]
MSTDLAIFGGEPIRKEPFPAWPRITEEMKQSLIHTFEEEEWGVGSKTITLFNEQFATMQDAKYCLSIHSGTSAIWICLKAAGIEAGDEVILPSYTFIATATAVVLANAVPVFADIDKKTANLDPNSVEKLITKKTKAIIPVHTAGAPADMKAFLDISKKYNIPIIE